MSQALNNILDRVKKGGKTLPPRIYLQGIEGIGKTSFAANAPDPLFLCVEGGLEEFPEIPRYCPKTWEDILAFVDGLIALDKIPYGSFTLDTADWMERLDVEYVCRIEGVENIEKVGGGYGKGAARAVQELHGFLRRLDALRVKHGTRIIILGHVHIKPFTDPAGEQWDRWEAKGNKGFTGMLREWADCVLFASRSVVKIKRKDGRGEKAGGGDRVIHTTWQPGFDAKNRLSLPETIDLSWSAYQEAEEESRPAALVARAEALITALLPTLDDEEKKKWEIHLPKLKTYSAANLRRAVSRLQEIE